MVTASLEETMTRDRQEGAPHVRLLDPGRQCPAGLGLRTDLVDPGSVDALVIVTDDPALVRSTVALSPPAPVLVVASVTCPPERVSSLFEAGADACVRGRNAREIEAHLLALLRRSHPKDGEPQQDRGPLLL